MKLLLIYPPTKQGVQSLLLQTEGEGIGNKPPLGLLYIASFVHKNSDHEVFVIDMNSSSAGEDEIFQKIRTLSPDVIGISCWTDFWYPIVRVIKLIKEFSPEVHITLGGPHVGIYSKEILAYDGVDSIILGDGEAPMLSLLNHLSNDEPLMKVGVYLKNSPPPDELHFYVEKNIDDLPFPERTLLPLEDYHSVLAKGSTIATMITSRGCPHRCVYCKLHFQKPVSRKAESVVDEMAQIERLGFHELEIYDDTFTWSLKRVIKICQLIIQRGIKLKWSVRDRVSNISEEVLDLMYQAGCNRIHLGIETGNERILKNIKKKISLEQAKRSVAVAKRRGLKVLTYFMVGLPGETEKDVMETIDFAINIDSDYAEFNVCIPYPGTEMYHDALSKKIIPLDFWREYLYHPVPNFKIPYLYEEFLTKEGMTRLSNLATKKFYFRPKVIVRELLSCSSFNEFQKKARMGLSLARNVFR